MKVLKKSVNSHHIQVLIHPEFHETQNMKVENLFLSFPQDVNHINLKSNKRDMPNFLNRALLAHQDATYARAINSDNFFTLTRSKFL